MHAESKLCERGINPPHAAPYPPAAARARTVSMPKTPNDSNPSLRKAWPILAIVALLAVGAVGTWFYFLRNKPASVAAPAGGEINDLTQAEAQPPNDGEIVAIPCKKVTELKADEYIVGRPGAFLKVNAKGEMKQSSGEELVSITSVFDPTLNDQQMPLQMECAEDAEETGDISWFVATLKSDQFFATRKGIKVTLTTDKDQTDFQTRINTACVVQNEVPDQPPTTACVRPKLFATTDLNGNGKKEYWFNEPHAYDMGIGVIEEPQTRLLNACPGCAD